MNNITDEDMKSIWDEINRDKNPNLKMPKLFTNKEEDCYTEGSLVLTYLYKNINIPIHKTELTRFISEHRECNDLQGARHLGAQKGWFILSGTRGDIHPDTKLPIPTDHYLLYSIKDVYPRWKSDARLGTVTKDEWELILKFHEYKCVACDSEEGKPHVRQQSVMTKLEKGHINPEKELSLTNCFPMCKYCNSRARNLNFEKVGKSIDKHKIHFQTNICN